MMIRTLIVSACLVIVAASARAQGTWTITTADFQTQSVTLKSIDAAGVHVTPSAGGDEKVVAFPQFLELSRPIVSSPAAGKLILHLAGGDSLGGEPVGIKGNSLVWTSPIVGELSIPMKQLVAMTHPGGVVPDSRRREDVVTLANGDSLRGIVAGFADGKVTVQSDAGNNDVPLASITQINFAATAGTQLPANGYRVKFDDGSSVVVSSVTGNPEKVDLTIARDVVRQVELSRIAMIEQVNGPVSWLSARPAIENVYVPYIGSPRNNAAKMDRNWSGQDPIRFGAHEFAHGIGVHSYSRLSWNLDGSYQTFRTQYAIDTKDANTRADVTVRIMLDGKVVYEQKNVRAGTLSPVVVENLDAAKKLTLEVDYGDNLDTQDRFNWIEPALVKAKS